jgi:hypothetical protein
VFYVVAGHCIQSTIKGVKLSKKEDISPCHCAQAHKEQLSALQSSPRPTIERMPYQPTSHAVALSAIASSLTPWNF